MKMRNRVFAILSAIAVMLTMCLCATGCSDLSGLMEAYESTQNVEPEEKLDPGQSIYDLSMFNSLPQDYSQIDPAFWVAEKNGGKVYFLGSIHCADTTSYRLPEKIINAYLESDALAVECDIVKYESEITSNLMAQFSAAKDMMYTDGSKISNHLQPETYSALTEYYNKYLAQYASSMGYNQQTLEMMKPAVWMSLIENAQIEKSGLDSELGIDSHLLKIAHAQGKQVIEIESVEFQNDLLFGFSDDVNDLLMQSYASSTLDEQAQYMLDTYHAWQIGDLSVLLEKDEVDDAEYLAAGYTQAEIDEMERLSNEYNDAMLYNRNIGMCNKAKEMLDNGQNVFYVVGAAHMCGEKGIIEMLRAQGYTVEQIGGLGANGSAPATHATTTAQTTAQAVTTTPAPAFNGTTAAYNAVYESQYDVYEELYEYFGGTTRPAGYTTITAAVSDPTKPQETKPTTAATNTGNQNNGNSWGGWGNSDGPAAGRGLVY